MPKIGSLFLSLECHAPDIRASVRRGGVSLIGPLCLYHPESEFSAVCLAMSLPLAANSLAISFGVLSLSALRGRLSDAHVLAEWPRMTRGRDGSLCLSSMALSIHYSTPIYPGALNKQLSAFKRKSLAETSSKLIHDTLLPSPPPHRELRHNTE
jgi:hypothetical protein